MSILSKITRGRKEKPSYVLLHGEPGIGKSTFAAGAPNPIFLCSEDGTDELDVNRLRLNSYDEFMSAMDELIKTDHEYKTLVIDTIDHIEPMIFKLVCIDQKKKSINDIGYSKGFEFALDYWLPFIEKVEEVREKKGMSIILLAHTYVKSHNDPQLQESYDRWQIKLHHKASGLFVDKVDCVLFAAYETFTEENKGGKNKAFHDGTRLVYTEPRPSYIAKNRYSLPQKLPLSYDDFQSARKNKAPRDIDAVLASINALMPEVPDDIKKKAQEFLTKNKSNAQKLVILENRLKTIAAA